MSVRGGYTSLPWGSDGSSDKNWMYYYALKPLLPSNLLTLSRPPSPLQATTAPAGKKLAHWI